VPTMPATVIAERVGWTRGITVFKEQGRRAAPGLSSGRPGQPHHIARVTWRSATCGFRRSSCRWGSGRCAGRRSCRC
jgi:hypothetical protein